ncbi:hypothetical protein ACFV97_13870 [Streptomyces sp. NPDC059913]|uniref:hypothetical protein n=1 Tax=unclassified Streptomyces TaxID=2593676 RepID=UPI00365F0BA7
MSKDPVLREAVLSWLEHAGGVSPKSQSPGMLMLQPHWENVVAAAAAAAPRDEHPDLYTLGKGDGTLNQWTLLVESGLAYAAGLIAVGAPLSLAEVADDFIAFCTGPAPVAERWLLLNGTFPQGTRISLGQYTLQTFTADELLKTVPMPALHSIQPWSHALDLITGAPFLHLPEPGHKVTRPPDRSDATGPHQEAQHWQALLPLMLWDEELLQVDSVFTVARGRYFDLNHQDVPTRQDQHRGDAEAEVRATGDFQVQAADLPALTAFCTTISAKIDAVMAGRTHSRGIPKERAQRLQDAATRLLGAYQRTRHHDSAGETDYGKLLLDYVVCLELLLRSSNDRGGRGISSTLQSRASALFLSPEEQNYARALTREAYNARSCYAHGRAIKEQTEKEQQEKLQAVRLLNQKVILRWLILTPSGPEDLATLLDAAPGPGREERIDQPLRIFFTTTPPRRRPADIAPV